MRRLTITARVTLLCTLVTAVIAVLAIVGLALGEQQMLHDYYNDTLNYAADLASGDITWDNGRIEIDRDLDEMKNVEAAVYSMDGDLLYGRAEFEAPFAEKVRRLEDGGEWYILDVLVESNDGRQAWLRLYMAPGAAGSLGGFWQRLILVIFPALVIMAGFGGWLVARRAVRPVARITGIAGSIANGDDLKKRIDLRGADDELYRMANVFDDMLERLEAAFERERRFTADVAHELRTPVAAILAQSEFGISDAAGDADKAEALAEINRRAQGMRELIQKLLVISRMDAGQITPEAEYTDLATAAELVAEMFVDAAARKDMTIRVKVDGSAAVMGDQTMLTQALMNLVDNAVKYGKNGGSILVELNDSCEMVSMSVSDNGPGMTEEQAARVFERFYQADVSRRAEGAGLGLSLVKRIVQLHSGEIRLESCPGKGSRFTITLPKGGILK